MSANFPFLGFGLGLRHTHYAYILEHLPAIDWFEILTENYLVDGGRPHYYLDKIRQHYPMVMHGVSMSIGSCDPLNMEYLQKVKKLIAQVDPVWVSDHLCWTGIDGINLHDLMPLPYTDEAINHVVERVQQVQDFLGRQILLENVSSYLTYQDSGITEWEFLSEIAKRADCYILLDVNNIFVSSFNHHFDPMDYLNGIDPARVKQFHLAGHLNKGKFIIDTHDAPVIDSVWNLYRQAVRRFGRVSTMIERDDNIPQLTTLLAELSQAKAIAEEVYASEAKQHEVA